MSDYDNYEPRRWGIEEARSGGLRPPAFPHTLYRTQDDELSGIAGLWMPSGEVLPIEPSKVGTYITFTDEDFRRKQALVNWDGCVEEEVHTEPIGYWDDDEKEPIFQGHSKGLLLGDYANNGELYRAWTRGTGMRGLTRGKPEHDTRDHRYYNAHINAAMDVVNDEKKRRRVAHKRRAEEA